MSAIMWQMQQRGQNVKKTSSGNNVSCSNKHKNAYANANTSGVIAMKCSEAEAHKQTAVTW